MFPPCAFRGVETLTASSVIAELGDPRRFRTGRQVAAYCILGDGVECHELGSDRFHRHTKQKTVFRLLQRLDDLGCQVAINTT